MTRRVDFKLNIDEITPRKKDVRKAITELRKSNKIPKRGYKPNIIGIIEEFGLVTLSLRVFERTERDRILKEIILADYENRDFNLTYDWELLDSLKGKGRKEE